MPRYYRNAGTVTEDERNAEDGREGHSSWSLFVLQANQRETNAVIVFLGGLTDQSFLGDSALANPWLENNSVDGVAVGDLQPLKLGAFLW